MNLDRAALQRWLDFGGYWRVIEADRHSATVSMCRCDGGEEVERQTTYDPDLIRWLSEHVDSSST